MQTIEVQGRKIGGSAPCFMIAEVAQAHDGSLGLAHAFIDAAAKAQVDAVKFQTHIAKAESTPSEPWRIQFSSQDKTRYDYWKRMEFSEAQWTELKKHCDDRKLVFLSSPFSVEAVELLERVGVPAWKVGSGEVTNTPLFSAIAKTKKPVLLSTGMSSSSELKATVQTIRSLSLPLALFQCTSMYPTPPEKIGLNLIREMREAFGIPVGLSDHSANLFTGVAAVCAGASLVEVHLTLSRDMFGPDLTSSLTTEELKLLVEGIRWCETLHRNPVNKDLMAQELLAMKQTFQKSIVAKVDLPAGTLLQSDHLAFKKPGTGVSPDRIQEVLGRRLAKAVKADELILEDYLT